jgi:Trm5-related predicted tRNA methylase
VSAISNATEIITTATTWSYWQVDERREALTLQGQKGTLVVYSHQHDWSEVNPNWITPDNGAFPTCVVGKSLFSEGSEAEKHARRCGYQVQVEPQDLASVKAQALEWLKI